MALRAVVQAHPHPTELLHAWRRLRADRVAAAYALPAEVRSSEWLSQHVQAFAEDWTAELVDAVTGQGERLGVSSPDSQNRLSEEWGPSRATADLVRAPDSTRGASDHDDTGTSRR